MQDQSDKHEEQELVDHFNTHGWAVVRSAFQPDVEMYAARWKKHLDSIGLDLEDPSTWQAAENRWIPESTPQQMLLPGGTMV